MKCEILQCNCVRHLTQYTQQYNSNVVLHKMIICHTAVLLLAKSPSLNYKLNEKSTKDISK